MARKVRIEYPGAVYHVMNRGDRRDNIFWDDDDRNKFIDTLGQCCEKTNWQIHAYVLMPNHFHVVVETPQPNLVAGMKWLLGTYTGRFNRRHRLVGHLFAGRYKALIVDNKSGDYLRTVCNYVHLNPDRARLIAMTDPLRSYSWSSWPDYLLPPHKRPAWLRVDRLLGEWGIPRDSPTGRRRLEGLMEQCRRDAKNPDDNTIRKGWCLGSKQFRKELLAQVSKRLGAEHYGAERHESQVEKAERIIYEELRRRKLTYEQLVQRSKGDAIKIEIGKRLRNESVMTVQWIAGRLAMGSRSYAANLLWQAQTSNSSNSKN